jgi:enterochelin esterase-like enzyme
MKILIINLCFICFSISVFAQSKVIQSITMESKLLNTNVNYSVYLPDGFDTNDELYPVVYLLNGYTGDETNWSQYGNLKEIADQLITNKQVNPMVIVMPDGDDRLYMNKDDGTYPYEDMFITEFLPFIEKAYRIKQDKTYRALSGLSMGGAGTLRLALKYNNLFNSCAAYSSAIMTEEEVITNSSPEMDNYFGRVDTTIKGLKGEERITETIKSYDVLNLVKTENNETLKTVNIYFDCGDDDFLAIGNAQLHIELKKKKIPHEYRVRDGEHNWGFWRKSLPEGLQFISNSMNN